MKPVTSKSHWRLSRQALELIRKDADADPAERELVMGNLAGLYVKQGMLGEAESLSREILAFTEKRLGPDDPAVALSLNNLAYVYSSQGKLEQAEPLYKRSLAISEKSSGPDSPDAATSLNNLAMLYQKQGRYADAERSTNARLPSGKSSRTRRIPIWPYAWKTWRDSIPPRGNRSRPCPCTGVCLR